MLRAVLTFHPSGSLSCFLPGPSADSSYYTAPDLPFLLPAAPSWPGIYRQDLLPPHLRSLSHRPLYLLPRRHSHPLRVLLPYLRPALPSKDHTLPADPHLTVCEALLIPALSAHACPLRTRGTSRRIPPRISLSGRSYDRDRPVHMPISHGNHVF